MIKKFAIMACNLFLLSALSLSVFAQDRTLVKKAAPSYPEMARRMHVGGAVVVKITIGPDGKVKSASALSGHPLLTQAAVSAVKEWVYSPGAEETRNVEINFTAQ
jgi:TonB family protein